MPRYAVRLYDRHADTTAWVQTGETSQSPLDALVTATARGYVYTTAEVYDDAGERLARYEEDQ